MTSCAGSQKDKYPLHAWACEMTQIIASRHCVLRGFVIEMYRDPEKVTVQNSFSSAPQKCVFAVFRHAHIVDWPGSFQQCNLRT